MSHPKEEKTFLMVKPDGVTRGLTGEIIRRVEQVGLKIISLVMVKPTREQMDDHYPKNDEYVCNLGKKTLVTYEKFGYDAQKELGTTDDMEIGKMVRDWLLDFMTSAPVVKMVIKGPHAVEMMRKMVGNTMPAQAEMGTIRGDFSTDSAASANRDKRAVFNIVHASGTIEEAEAEISHWTSPEDIFDYTRAEEHAVEKISQDIKNKK
ncbi:MAG: hypothetical protein ACD_68C00005G0002 [uncultured bacterium]|nr:MAG: hypothetical protein ACD_68C00005G0002 [uncultured bacterium]